MESLEQVPNYFADNNDKKNEKYPLTEKVENLSPGDIITSHSGTQRVVLSVDGDVVEVLTKKDSGKKRQFINRQKDFYDRDNDWIESIESPKTRDTVEIKSNIFEVNDFDELEVYLKYLPEDGLRSSSKFYPKKELITLVKRVINGELHCNYVTRTGGLRQKVKELLKKNESVELIKNKSDESDDLIKSQNEREVMKTAIHEIFENAEKDPETPELTKELLNNPDFYPEELLKIGNRDFYMGKIIDIQKGTRDEVIMYVRNKNGKFAPRVLYKSQSDGGWRSCPGSRPLGYSKGVGIHYTQETKLHEDIIAYLDKNKDDKVACDEDILQERFQIDDENDELNEKMKGVYTYKEEVFAYDDKGVLDQFREYRPGHNFERPNGNLARDYFRKLDFSKPELKSFIPDFSEPVKSMQLEHSLLGDITVEKFPAKLNDRNIEWNVAYDKAGRVWIDSIKFAEGNNNVNSYGIASEVINSGLLTNKPIEYNTQTIGLAEDVDIVCFKKLDDDFKYMDITYLLDNLEPIQKFRDSRAIYRSK